MRIAAAESGLLPHEWLLKVSRGDGILHHRVVIKYDRTGKEIERTVVEEVVYADFTTRVDAAKAAAPFFAPKLAVQTITPVSDMNALSELLKEVASRMPN